jgi:TPR repeat protein
MYNNMTIEKTRVLAEQGDMEAQFNMGFAHKNGIEVSDAGELKIVTHGYKEAFEWFTKAAEQGHVDAQNSLGLMCKEGLATLQNDYEAFDWFTKAAEQGHADAQNNLGLIYRDGKETPEVVYMILHDYELTETIPSDHDYEELFRDFGLDSPETFDYLDVAKALSEKKGIDYNKAIDWFTKAAEQGHSDAQYELAIMYKKGEGVDQNHTKAEEWYTKAAEQGNTRALERLKRMDRIATDRLVREQYDLGVMYKEELGVRQDYMKAFECYNKAAEQGHSDAQYELAIMYKKGQGVPQNSITAAEWYAKAAERGHTCAQYDLGVMYEEGQGVPQNSITAAEWYIKAAEQGHSDAQEILLCKYEEGNYFLAQNYHKLNPLFLITAQRGYNRAVEWLIKIAEQGNDNNQLTLANMYKKGQGVPQDYAKAFELYIKVAEKGHADTQITVADMYKMGEGIDQNYAKAVEWYTKAAEQGIHGAQYNLAIMYEKGLGVLQDTVKAEEWHTKAAENEIPF